MPQLRRARAGEHGKGFAVVASEINKLASDTADAVTKIQETIDGVQDAFSSLSGSATEMLDFLKNTVTPDYDNFVNIGKQYGDDANSFGEQAARIAEMVDNIKESIDEVNKAVLNIAESTQETASHSSDITESVNTVSEVVDSVSDMSGKQEQIAQTLDSIVSGFKLK